MYYQHIDGLRALAVFSVLLCHLGFTLFSGGFIGVDVFFVISGFLISGIILKQLDDPSGFSFLNFYARRIKRIFPALFFTLSISFILSICLLNPAKFKVFGSSLLFAALSTSNLYLKQHAGYFDVLSQTNPLLHTWSLSVEEQFYLLFPFVLYLWHKFVKARMYVLILLIFMLSFALNLYFQNSDLIALYYLFYYRAFEFCIGAFVVYLMKSNIKPASLMQEFLCFVGILLIIIPIFMYDSKTLFPTYNALWPCLGAALVLFSGSARYCGLIFRIAPVRYIGLISYSLYLIHWPLIIFYKNFNENMWGIFEITLTQKFIIIGLSLILSTLMYRYVEQAFRVKKQRLHKPAPERQIAQGLLLVFITAGLGYSISLSKGWLWRVTAPNEIAKLENLSEYHVSHWGGANYKGGYIHRGKENKAHIVLMGDSHAGMLDEGLVHELARPYELTLFTASGGGAGKYSSSMLLPGITSLGNPQSLYDETARTAYKEALTRLHSNANPQNTLILSSAWNIQLNKAGYLKNHQTLGIDTRTMASWDDYQPFIHALDAFLKLMNHKKLVIIGDVPGSPHYNAASCLYKLRWFSSRGCWAREKEQSNKAALNVNHILSLYAASRKNVYFLNPYTVFCRKNHCDNLDTNGNPYYSDTSHLSKAGSIYLMNNFAKKIIDIMG